MAFFIEKAQWTQSLICTSIPIYTVAPWRSSFSSSSKPNANTQRQKNPALFGPEKSKFHHWSVMLLTHKTQMHLKYQERKSCFLCLSHILTRQAALYIFIFSIGPRSDEFSHWLLAAPRSACVFILFALPSPVYKPSAHTQRGGPRAA